LLGAQSQLLLGTVEQFLITVLGLASLGSDFSFEFVRLLMMLGIDDEKSKHGIQY
jgi:hypothetical protein